MLEKSKHNEKEKKSTLKNDRWDDGITRILDVKYLNQNFFSQINNR